MESGASAETGQGERINYGCTRLTPASLFSACDCELYHSSVGARYTVITIITVEPWFEGAHCSSPKSSARRCLNISSEK